MSCTPVYGAEMRTTHIKLGVDASELGAVACFFDVPWSRIPPALTEADQAWLMAVAAFDPRALGRWRTSSR